MSDTVDVGPQRFQLPADRGDDKPRIDEAELRLSSPTGAAGVAAPAPASARPATGRPRTRRRRRSNLDLISPPAATTLVRFTSASVGYAGSSSGCRQGEMLWRTVDGGRSWSRSPERAQRSPSQTSRPMNDSLRPPRQSAFSRRSATTPSFASHSTAVAAGALSPTSERGGRSHTSTSRAPRTGSPSRPRTARASSSINCTSPPTAAAPGRNGRNRSLRSRHSGPDRRRPRSPGRASGPASRKIGCSGEAVISDARGRFRPDRNTSTLRSPRASGRHARGHDRRRDLRAPRRRGLLAADPLLLRARGSDDERCSRLHRARWELPVQRRLSLRRRALASPASADARRGSTVV